MMNRLALASESVLASPTGPPLSAPRSLQEALGRWAPNGESDRRSDDRRAIPMLVQLTPLDSRNGSPACEPMTVVGKDLSVRGVGIYHEARLPHRYCELRFEEGPFGSLTLQIELTWTRFTRLGWYESGGRVITCRETEAA